MLILQNNYSTLLLLELLFPHLGAPTSSQRKEPESQGRRTRPSCIRTSEKVNSCLAAALHKKSGWLPQIGLPQEGTPTCWAQRSLFVQNPWQLGEQDMRRRSRQEHRLTLVMCGTILVAPLYLEQEVRIDEEEGQQLAAGTGVVARPGFVARAGDRRLFTGAASLVRIFLLPPTKGYSLES